jgi:hypothetical protein
MHSEGFVLRTTTTMSCDIAGVKSFDASSTVVQPLMQKWK